MSSPCSRWWSHSVPLYRCAVVYIPRSTSQAHAKPAFQVFVGNQSLKLCAERNWCVENNSEMRLDLVPAFFQYPGVIPECSQSSVDGTFDPHLPELPERCLHQVKTPVSNAGSFTSLTPALTVRLLCGCWPRHDPHVVHVQKKKSIISSKEMVFFLRTMWYL